MLKKEQGSIQKDLLSSEKKIRKAEERVDKDVSSIGIRQDNAGFDPLVEAYVFGFARKIEAC